MTDAEVLNALRTRRAAVLTEIAAISATTAGGKPNHTGEAAVDHQGYKRGLYEELDTLNAQIAAYGGVEDSVTYAVI